MNWTGLLLIVVLMLASGIATTTPTSSGAKTIVVPDTYPTITEALTNAQSGDTIFIREGNYSGPINQTITVDKTISIVGENNQNTTINLQPAYTSWWILTAYYESSNDAIAFEADDCQLSNLTLVNYHGAAISAVGNRMQITGNNITSTLLVNGSRCNIADNICPAIRANVSYSNIVGNSAPSYINVEGSYNLIKNNDCRGISLSGTRNVVNSNLLTNDYGYSAINLGNCNDNVIYRNEVAGTFGYGLDMWFSSDNLIVANSLTNCHVGSFALGGCFNNRIYLNSIKNSNWYDRYYYDFYSDRWIRNGTSTIEVSHNFWDNGSMGNYWSNYNGTDANWDGIGDEPYVLKLSVEHFEGENTEIIGDSDNYPLMNPLDIVNVGFELPHWVDSVGTETPIDNLTIPEQSTQIPSPTATLQPEETGINPINQALIMGIVGIVVVVAVAGVVLVVYCKKR